MTDKIDEDTSYEMDTIDKDQVKDLLGKDDEKDMDYSPDGSENHGSGSSFNESFDSSFEKNKKRKKSKSKSKGKSKSKRKTVESDDGSEDDSESDALHILSGESEDDMVCEEEEEKEDDIKDLEDKLSEEADKNNFTANNVKNLLKQLITDKDVVSMVKNTVEMEEGSPDHHADLVEASYEPKMTRSKLKEEIEKGKVPPVWPLSPLKKGSKNKPSFLELEFSDDEDDEYNPERDPVRESDDESTSFLSSQASDFGSPCPLTPSTPANQLRPSTLKKEIFVSPTAPVSKSVKTDLVQAFNRAAETDEEFLQREIDEDYDTVARRTRSKLPLTSRSLNELESTLIEVAPDITDDMYETNLGQDSEWQEFLTSLYTCTKIDVAPQDTHDDETNDPEYDYLGEAELEEKDEEDFKYSRPHKIPKKEMIDLLDQWREFIASDQEDDDTTKFTNRSDSTESESNKKRKTKSHKPSTEGLEFTSSQLLILQDQMRQHVQLISQLHFLCLASEDYNYMTKDCKKLLNELDMFRKSSSFGEENSYYNICNLSESIELVEQERHWDINKEVEEIQSLSFEEISNVSDSDDNTVTDNSIKRNQEALIASQKEVFWNNRVFFYSELLPKRRLMTRQEAKESRVFFTPGEDKLIVLGMSQFGDTPKNYNEIHKYLLPAKSTKQIAFRCKNLTSKRAGDNPIKLYKKKKILPENATLYHIFSLDNMKPPREQNIDLLPNWCKNYKIELDRKMNRPTEGIKNKHGDDVDDKKVENEKEEIPKSKKRKFKASTKAKKTPQKAQSTTATCMTLSPNKSADVPTALITSAGLFVPIRFASPSKLPPNLQHVVIDSSPLYQLPVPKSNITPEKLDSPGNYYNTLTPDSTCNPSPKVSPDDKKQEVSTMEPVSTVVSQSQWCALDAPGLSVATSISKPSNEQPGNSDQQPENSKQQPVSISNPKPSSATNYIFMQSVSNQLSTSSSITQLSTDLYNNQPDVSTTHSTQPSLLNQPLFSSQPNVSTTYTLQPSSTNQLSTTACNNQTSVSNQSLDYSNQHVTTFTNNSLTSNQQSVLGVHQSTSSQQSSVTAISQLTTSIQQSASAFNQQLTSNFVAQPSVPNQFSQPQNDIPDSTAQFIKLSDYVTSCEENREKDPTVTSPQTSQLQPCEQNSGDINEPNCYHQSDRIIQSPTQVNNIQLNSLDETGEKSKTGSPVECMEVDKPDLSEKSVPVSKTIVAVTANNLSGIVVTTPVPSPLNMEVISNASNDVDTIPRKGTPQHVTPSKADQTIGSKADTSTSFLSTPSSLASSLNSSSSTPKRAVEIVATLAPFYASYLVDPALSQQSQLETTPNKKYRELAPKSDIPVTSPKQLFLSPLKRKSSPKVTRLKKGVRAILPKVYIHEMKISPTKRAANQIKRKAAKMYHKGSSPNKLLLPKPPVFTDTPLYPNTRYQKQNLSYNNNINNNSVPENEENKQSESEKMEESDDHHSEVEDACVSQDESQPEDDLDDMTVDDNLEELMEASTTIRFDPRKSSQQLNDNKTKAQRRKELNIALLAPDILESDPKRDDRDTAFAQAYMHQVKETLSNDMKTYEEFLLLMCEFGKGTQSPISLYKCLCELLKNYPDLIEDFAGFLRPEEAVECDCFSVNQEYQRANEFLRKLEINFAKQPTQFKRILMCFDKWQKNINHTGDQLKTQIRSLLRSSPLLLQEFDMFFPEEKIPECHPCDFEEVNLSDNSDIEDENKYDGFEEVDIPEEYDTYRTKRCKCDCHNDPTDTKLQARLKHCYECCLKNVDGGLYFQTSKNKLQPVRVIIHKIPPDQLPPDSPVSTNSPSPTLPSLTSPSQPDDTVSNKENEMSPPLNCVINNTGDSPLKHCSLKKAKKMKLKTEKKPGEKRFLSINEITSPVKCSESNSVTRTLSTATSTVVSTNLTNSDSKFGDPPSSLLTSLPDKIFTREDSNISLSTLIDPNKPITFSQDSSKPWATINENSSSDLLAKAMKGTIGHIATKPFLVNEHSTADILAAALKEAEIQRGDVSVDSIFFRTLMSSPSKSQMGQTSSGCTSQLSFSGALTPIISSTLFSSIPNSNTPLTMSSVPITQQTINTVNTSQTTRESDSVPVKLNTALTVSSIVTPNLPTQVNNSTVLPTSSVCEIKSSSNVLMPEPSVTVSEIVQQNKTLSQQSILPIYTSHPSQSTMSSESRAVTGDTSWSRDMDRIILEMCQVDGTSQQTFSKIAEKLGNRTAEEVSDRLKVLMELLADSHDEESEEEMSEG